MLTSQCLYITDRSKAVVLLWFSVTCFSVSFCDVSPCVCSYYFSSGWVSGHLLGCSLG